MSVYALARGSSAIIFAPVMGQYIDIGNRLQVVRISIVLQRLVVAVSCVMFYLLINPMALDHGVRIGMFVLLTALACVEKLCSIMNLVSVEKDWVVVVCNDDEDALRMLNAQMRRIDLLCKLLGPMLIALLVGISTKIAILTNLAMNVGSVVIEYFAIARVYYDVAKLQEPKKSSQSRRPDTGRSTDLESRWAHTWNHVKQLAKKSRNDFSMYLQHRAFLPSIAGALLYLTVLSFSGQMVTYLLSAGYTAAQVGIARTVSVAFEVVATWVAPWLMGLVGPARAGLWLSSSQVLMLVAGTVVFFIFYDKSPLVSASGLVGGTIFSRVGLFGFDLCTQFIVQEDVEAGFRGAFSTIEAACQNAFELVSFASTIIFFRPEQFRWPVLLSLVAVTTASSAYALYIRRERGHLVHPDALMKLLCGLEEQPKSRCGAVDRIASHSDV
ncbi:hypothetical protein LTS18_006161 [Coniosporium uncinatum]|uniref:Uncharacterized protein n=1 Tax=Coniosporium uncinatum TaxID=93489 RepID=A0ACC3DCZ2_9PEZI|nr:hypothetical protein LTS18_006161 [Coniosporium uncinatum]